MAVIQSLEINTHAKLFVMVWRDKVKAGLKAVKYPRSSYKHKLVGNCTAVIDHCARHFTEIELFQFVFFYLTSSLLMLTVLATGKWFILLI